MPSGTPSRDAFRDVGTEYGLLILGVMGPLLGAQALFSRSAGRPEWLSWAGAVCVVLGIACLVLYHRVYVSDMSPSAKTTLRIAMLGAAVFFYWVKHSSR